MSDEEPNSNKKYEEAYKNKHKEYLKKEPQIYSDTS
jgi:hypothetical protein